MRRFFTLFENAIPFLAVWLVLLAATLVAHSFHELSSGSSKTFCASHLCSQSHALDQESWAFQEATSN